MALAHILAEDRVPPVWLWDATLVSSRLLEYELWTRLNARGLAGSHGEFAREVVQRIAFLELAPPVLARALEPFPIAMRRLDALHLASIEFLRSQRQELELASYDVRMRKPAARMKIPIATLGSELR